MTNQSGAAKICFHLMQRRLSDILRYTAVCIYYNESFYRLSNDIKRDDLERCMFIYNVRKPHRPPMSDTFLPDSVDTTLAIVYIAAVLSELHDQLAKIMHN